MTDQPTAPARSPPGLPSCAFGLIRQANGGVSVARNAGMRMLAEGDACGALLFLDADDCLAPDAPTRLAAALDVAPCAVVASGPYVFVGGWRVRTAPSGDILPHLLVRNLFANSGHVRLRSEAVRQAGEFLGDIAFGEDWEYWTRIALQGPFVSVRGRAPVLFVRQHVCGAYARLATDPGAFQPCMDAIFANSLLTHGFSGLASLHPAVPASVM
jgi:hypothetical protein